MSVCDMFLLKGPLPEGVELALAGGPPPICAEAGRPNKPAARTAKRRSVRLIDFIPRGSGPSARLARKVGSRQPRRATARGLARVAKWTAYQEIEAIRPAQ